jgi:hypothetical protein
MSSAIGKDLLAAFVFCTVACVVSAYLGQDTNFDLQQYHIHNAWAVLNGRWAHDIFVAGAQTFFSPFLDIPYYVLATLLLPSHGGYLVALAGIPYGAVLFLIYLIGRRIADSLELGAWDRIAFVGACVLLGGTGATTGSLIGTTTNDITIAALVLAAFHQVLAGLGDSGEPLRARRIAVAGLLLGLAMGLKLTAYTYVAAMAMVIFALAQGWRSRIRGLVILGCVVLAVFVAAYGPWAWKLYQLTGNPFFPMLNGVFQSDWMTSINVQDDRFLPRSWLQWVFFPFYWASLPTSIVMPMPFRDPRLAIAYVLVAGYALAAFASSDLRKKFLRGPYRPVHAVVLFVVFSYLLWMRESSIHRYLVATEILASVFIIIVSMALVHRLGRRAKWAPAACLTAIAGLIIGCNVYPQWGRAPTGTDIFAVQVPALEPGALIVFADHPMAFLAPALAAANPSLSFMTIPRHFATRGAFADGFTHELGRRMQARVAANTASLYVLFQKGKNAPQPEMAAFGIELDATSCRPGRSSLGLEFLVCRGARARAPAG